MSINLIRRIFADYHKGKDSTNGRKYRYTIEYNPLAAMPCSRFRLICKLLRYTPPVWVVWSTKGVRQMIFSCILFFFWFFSALFKASK